MAASDHDFDLPEETAGIAVATAEKRQLRAYIGRQPIYNVIREIQAYELLHRLAVEDHGATFADGNQASAEVVLQAFMDIGLKRVSPSQPVFINHTGPLLCVEPIVPADRCVIEVLEDVPPTAPNLTALRRLKNLGYKVALDDFVYSDETRLFLELADYVKLDVRAMTPQELEWHVALLKPLHKRIIAEKVESEAEFQRCRGVGCDLFQGYYLRRPDIVTGARIPSNRLSALALLTECMVSQWKPIAAVIERDPTLTFGVLQMANSVLLGTSRVLRSVNEAVVRMGTDRIFRWAILLVLAGQDNCPSGYMEFALQRAHMSEAIAGSAQCSRSDGYLIGLLSTLDSVLDAPLPQVIGPLPIPQPLIDAILNRAGRLGQILDAVIAYETCQFESAAAGGVDIGVLQTAFWEAAETAKTMMGRLQASRPVLRTPIGRP